MCAEMAAWTWLCVNIAEHPVHAGSTGAKNYDHQQGYQQYQWVFDSPIGSKKPVPQMHEIQGTPHKQCECPGDKSGEQTNDEECTAGHLSYGGDIAGKLWLRHPQGGKLPHGFIHAGHKHLVHAVCDKDQSEDRSKNKQCGIAYGRSIHAEQITLNPSPDAKAMDYTHTPGKFALWRGKEKNTAARAVSMETTHKR